MYVDSKYSIVDLRYDDIFVVNVSVVNAFDLYAWQFRINYDVGFFEVTDVYYPPDYVFAEKENVVLPDPLIDNELGYVLVGASLIGSEPTFRGNGTLASVKFVAKIPGNWTLALDTVDSYLLDSNLNEIPCEKIDGYVVVEPYPVPEAELFMTPMLTVVDDPYLVNAEYEDISIDVNVSNVFGLHAWQIGIQYNSTILECLSPTADNTAGYVVWSYSLSKGNSINGNVNLGTIKFRVRSIGNSSLQFDLNNTRLWLPNFLEISYETAEAYIQVKNYHIFNVVYHYRTYKYPPTPPGLFIYPRHSFANIGQNFTVEVSLNKDAYAWQAKILYNSTILQVNRVWYTSPAHGPTPIIDNSEGYVIVGDCPMGGVTRYEGNETFLALAGIEFSVIGDGKSLLVFDSTDSFLLDSDFNKIPCNLINGYFNYSANSEKVINKLTISTIERFASWNNSQTYITILYSSSEILNYNLDPIERKITYEVNPIPYFNRTQDFSTLTIPKGLLNQNFTVFVDNNSTAYTKWENTTHIFLNFTYTHNQHTIEIHTFNTYLFNISKNGETYVIRMLTNSSVTSFRFDENLDQINFNVTGLTGTQGYCNVTIPKNVFNSTFAILVNGIVTPYIKSENSDYTFIHFKYNHSNDNIKILSTVIGDVNGDKKVDINDIATVALSFGSFLGGLRWNPIADLTGSDYLVPDGKIDILDIALVAKHFGEAV
jgi:hypothetical protein